VKSHGESWGGRNHIKIDSWRPSTRKQNHGAVGSQSSPFLSWRPTTAEAPSVQEQGMLPRQVLRFGPNAVVAFGDLDPDFGSVPRNSAKPGRLAEH